MPSERCTEKQTILPTCIRIRRTFCISISEDRSEAKTRLREYVSNPVLHNDESTHKLRSTLSKLSLRSSMLSFEPSLPVASGNAWLSETDSSCISHRSAQESPGIDSHVLAAGLSESHGDLDGDSRLATASGNSSSVYLTRPNPLHRAYAARAC